MDLSAPIKSCARIVSARCAFEGCGKPPTNRLDGLELCRGHHAQKERGEALSPLRSYVKGDIRARMEKYAPPGDTNECWLWQGGLRRGHGAVWHNGKQRGAHCVAWELANGQEVPEDMVVRHKCDVPACVNPNHLELGTQQQNVLDMLERGRFVAPSGYRHRTQREKTQIRELYREGVQQAKLARIFGCSHQTIARIVKDIE